MKKVILIILWLMSLGMNGQTKFQIDEANEKIRIYEFEEAIVILDNTLSLKSKYYHEALYLKAICFEQLGQSSKAKKIIKKILRTPEGDKNQIHLKGLTYYLYGRIASVKNQKKKAVKLFKEAAVRLNDSKSYSTLGYKQIQLKRYNQARISLNKAIDLNPKNGYAHSNLGFVLIQVGKYDAALLELNKALELTPSNPYVHKHLALLYIAQGKYDKACEELYEAVKKGYIFFNEGKESDVNEVDDLIDKYCKMKS